MTLGEISRGGGGYHERRDQTSSGVTWVLCVVVVVGGGLPGQWGSGPLHRSSHTIDRAPSPSRHPHGPPRSESSAVPDFTKREQAPLSVHPVPRPAPTSPSPMPPPASGCSGNGTAAADGGVGQQPCTPVPGMPPATALSL